MAARAPTEDKVYTWPHLVRAEFICTLLILLLLMIWSVAIDAPLEEAANPTRTPNPSKAPWYFLGLQEMLVFFDPWHAGVVLPSLIIVGLMVIPYIDTNPVGNGYYCFRPRKYEILTFYLGFHILWVSLIVIGTFLRGPGWNWFWPWQTWDPHLVEAMTNVDLPYLMGCRSYGCQFWVGGSLTIGFFVFGTIAFYAWIVKIKGREWMREWGLARFGVTSFLFLNMVATVIKMLLRHLMAVKYIWVIQTPLFSINI